MVSNKENLKAKRQLEKLLDLEPIGKDQNVKCLKCQEWFNNKEEWKIHECSQRYNIGRGKFDA